jgi:transcriptional regulator with XRE-family HTH domain
VAATLTQAQLAQRVGVAQAAISRIERDETHDPGVLIVAGIARALDLSLDVLVEGNALARAPRPSLEDRVAALEDALASAQQRRAVDDGRDAEHCEHER